MLTEADLHPFTASDPTGQPVLVLAPHPDDETIGCGGTLALHQRAGDRICAVFLTDGGQGENRSEYADYQGVRRREAEEAARILGLACCHFWALPDRGLTLSEGLVHQLVVLIQDEQPGIIYAPSFLDLHPDHKTCAHAVWQAARAAKHPCQLWLYETTGCLRPNRMVDVSATHSRREAALRCYASQLAVRDYQAATSGLAQFRALTLTSATHAEAFFSVNVPDGVQVAPAAVMAGLMQADGIDVARRTVPISVVVRTRDRHDLLKEALLSLCRQTQPPTEVILVDSGATPAGSIVEELAGALPLTHRQAPRQTGRSAACNLGWQAASQGHVLFLDDDDLLLPDHLERLGEAAHAAPGQVIYSGYQVVTYRQDERGVLSEVQRETVRPELRPPYLYFENELALMAALVPRPLLEEVDGFDEELAGFEDWDLWIRLVQGGHPFRRLTSVSAIYRVIPELGAGTTQLGPDPSWWSQLFEKHRASIPGTAWAAWSYQRVFQPRAELKQRRAELPELEALRAFATSRAGRLAAGLQRWRRRLTGRSNRGGSR